MLLGRKRDGEGRKESGNRGRKEGGKEKGKEKRKIGGRREGQQGLGRKGRKTDKGKGEMVFILPSSLACELLRGLLWHSHLYILSS